MSGWTGWILASAVFLALYDLAKKASVRANAVLPVLLCSTCFGCAAFTCGLWLTGSLSVLATLGPREVALGLVKAVIVGTSWIFTFTGLRTLPITIATPIRATSPALVFVLALFLYGEVPTCWQGVGMLLVFFGYWSFSWAGKAEGIDFFRNRAVWCAIAGAFFSALSSLFDKYVFQKTGCGVEPVQFCFQAGLVLVYAAVLTAQRALRLRHDRFTWRWTIPLVGILLAAADWLYFHGLSVPDTPISAAALLRRFSVVLTFVLGAKFFHERNLRRKGIALAAVLLGVLILCLATGKSRTRVRNAASNIPRNPSLVRVTGYCNCGKCCSWKRNWFGFGEPVYNYGKMKGKPKKVGITASGTKAKKGTIAADPKVFPFGTHLFVPGYGPGTVEDIGGGVQGRHIDVWFSTHEEAKKWGSRDLKVRCLSECCPEHGQTAISSARRSVVPWKW